MVNKGNAQGMYQSASGRVGLAILPYPFRFFSWKVGHTPSCGQLLCDGDFSCIPPGVYTGKSPLQGNIRYIFLVVPLILEAAMVQVLMSGYSSSLLIKVNMHRVYYIHRYLLVAAEG